jgi:hypothetical protein
MGRGQGRRRDRATPVLIEDRPAAAAASGARTGSRRVIEFPKEEAPSEASIARRRQARSRAPPQARRIERTGRRAAGASGLAGAGVRCPDIQQKVKGRGKIRFAAVQCRIRPHIPRCDVVQDDDVAGEFLIAEGSFPGDGRFDHFHAGLDALDQGHEIGSNHAIPVVAIMGWSGGSAACCCAHDSSP